MWLVDEDLARLIEADQAESARHFVRIQAARHAGPAWIEVAGGVAAFGGPFAGPNVGRAWGLGLHGPVTADDVDRVEAFYDAQGARTEFMVCPFADWSLDEELGRRGYRAKRFEQVLVGRAEDVAGAIPDDLTIEPCHDPLVWWETTHEAFGFGPDRRDWFVEVARSVLSAPSHAFVARQGGQLVGGGVVFVGAQAGYLLGCGVPPAHRGRGIQRALVAVRGHVALDAGREWVFVGCAPQGASCTNLQRAGLRPAYTAVVMTRPAQA